MDALKGYINITRPINLLIVALLQYLMYYKLLLPIYKIHRVQSVFGVYLFPFFIIVTVLIAAAGNVINDIVDIEIDRLNKPDKCIVGNMISIRKAYLFYFILIVIGSLLSLYLAYAIEKMIYLFLYLFAVFFLFIYSRYFKRVLLLGNILVSLFTAGVIGIILIFEFETGLELKNVSIASYEYIQEVFFGFMIFSFLSSMFREIVKDIEDMDGDKIVNSNTLPLSFNKNVAKYIAGVFFILILVSVVYWSTMDLNIERIYLKFYMFIIVIPFLLLTGYLLIKAKSQNEFSSLSKMIKVFMMLGIFMLVSYFI